MNPLTLSRKFSYIIVLFSLLFFSTNGFSTTRYSIPAGGNLVTAGTWTTNNSAGCGILPAVGGAPVAGDDIIICSNVTLSATFAPLLHSITIMPGGTLTWGAGAFTISLQNATSFLTNNGTINMGPATGAGGFIFTLGGTINAGAASVWTAPTVFTGTAGLTVSAGAANTLVINGTGPVKVPCLVMTTAGQVTTNNANLTLISTSAAPGCIRPATATACSVINNGTLTIGTNNGANVTTVNTFTQGANSTLNLNCSAAGFNPTNFLTNANNNTVNYTCTAAQTIKAPTGASVGIYYHLGLSGALAKTWPAAGATAITSILGNFTTGGSCTSTLNAALTIGGDVVLGSTGALTAGAFTHVVKGNWSQTGAATSLTAGTSTFNFAGIAGNQTIGLISTFTTAFNNVTISNVVGTVFQNFSFNVAGTMNMNGAATIFSPIAAAQINGGGAVGTIQGTGKIFVSRVTAGTNNYANQYRFATNTIAGLTLEYNGTAAQDLTLPSATIAALLTSGTGNRTMGSAITTSTGGVTIGNGTILIQGANIITVTAGGFANNGTFTGGTVASNINGGVTNAGTFTGGTGLVTVSTGGFNNAAAGNFTAGTVTMPAGNLTNNGTFNAGSGTFTFSAAGGQTILGGTVATFNNLVTNSGGLTLSGTNSIAVNGILTFNGLITTNANKVTIKSAGSTVGPFSGTRHVVGNLEKFYTATGTKTFELGDGTNYLNVDINFTTLTTPGPIQVNLNLPAAVHATPPNPATEMIPTQRVNRTWTLVNNGALAGTFDLTLKYRGVGIDADAATVTSDVMAGVYNAGVWSFPSTAPATFAMGTRTATTTQITGLTMTTGIGDFQLGNPRLPTITAGQPINVTSCSGNPATFSVTAATGTGLTYQWRKGGVNIAGATSSSYTIPSVTQGVDDVGGNFDVVVSGNGVPPGVPATSTAVTLTINTPPTSFSVNPSPATVCETTALNLLVASDGNPVSYQWRRNAVNYGAPIAGNLSIASAANGTHDGNWDVVASVPGCVATITSPVVAVVVNRPPTAFSTSPIATTVCNLGSATLNVASDGDNVTYQWKRNGVNVGAPIAGNLTLSPATFGTDDGSYTVVATAPSCAATITSPAVALTINRPPTSFTTVPAATIACNGSAVTLNVASDGDNVTYQWRRNAINVGAPIAGNLSINPVTYGTDDGNYDVVATANSCAATITTPVVALTINRPPTVFTTAPSPLTVCSGSPATLNVASDGDNVTYQWKRNGVNVGGPIAGNLTISPATFGTDDGNYTVVATAQSCAATITSPSVALSINRAPTSFSVVPVASVACNGSAITLMVASDGDNVSYQWRRNSINVGAPIAGNLTINPANLGVNDGNYDVIATAASCAATITSPIAALTINTPPTSFSVSPSNTSVCGGNSLTLSATSDGNPVSYQWIRNGVNFGAPINGIPGDLTIPSATNGVHDGTWTVVASVPACLATITSPSATVVVNPGPTFAVQPLSGTTCINGTYTFTAIPNGSPSNQWKKNGVDIVGQTGTSLVINSATLADDDDYTMVQTIAGCAPFSSNIAHLTVNTPPAITSQPTAPIVCSGNTAVFTVSATGSNLNYSWMKNGSTTGVIQPNGPAYSITGATNLDDGNYTVAVSNLGCGSQTSQIATLTVSPAPTVSTPITNPASGAICENTCVTFNANYTGTSPIFQWKKGGVDIVGETNPILSICNATLADNAVYSLVVSSAGCPDAISATKALVVDQMPVITTQPSPSNTKCEGDNITLTVAATGTNLMYQWKRGSTSLFGENAASIVLNPIVVADGGNYTLVTSNAGCGAVTSSAANLVVNSAPKMITNLSPNTGACIGSSMSLCVTATGTAPLSYQWRKDAIDITGATNSCFAINSAAPSDSGIYEVVISGLCPSPILSNPTVFRVDPVSVAGAVSGTTSACYGTNAGTLTLSGQVGSILNWQSSENGINWFDIQNTATNSYSYQSLQNTTSFRAVVKSGSCNTVYATPAVITIAPSKFVGNLKGEAKVCSGSNEGEVSLINFKATVNHWESSPDGNTWTSIPNITTTTCNYKNLDATTFFRAVMNNGSCPPVASDEVVTINVDPRPKADFSVLPTVYVGQEVDFANASEYGTINDPILKYKWMFDNVGSSTEDSPKHSFSRAGTYKITLVAYSGNDCVDSTKKEIVVLKRNSTITTPEPGNNPEAEIFLEDHKVTNLITMNDNGVNDTWNVADLDKFVSSEVFIFNRYGSEVFHAKPYLNDWSGIYKGSRLPEGTYYYLLKVVEKEGANEVTIKGIITLIK